MELGVTSVEAKKGLMRSKKFSVRGSHICISNMLSNAREKHRSSRAQEAMQAGSES